MRTIIFCLAIIFSATSCDKEPVDNLVCTGDCLFKKVGQEGTISFTDCYDKWSITFDEDDLRAILINPDNELQVEGLRVEMDGLFFENDFPFLLPDPPGPINHKMEIRTYRILD